MPSAPGWVPWLGGQPCGLTAAPSPAPDPRGHCPAASHAGSEVDCGVAGVAGVAGAAGTTGVTGVAGVAGVTGVAGIAGVTGVAGVAVVLPDPRLDVRQLLLQVPAALLLRREGPILPSRLRSAKGGTLPRDPPQASWSRGGVGGTMGRPRAHSPPAPQRGERILSPFPSSPSSSLRAHARHRSPCSQRPRGPTLALMKAPALTSPGGPQGHPTAPLG